MPKAITIQQYLRSNSQPLYGLDVAEPVNLHVLFYQNMVINSFFDLKRANVDEARHVALAMLYWSVSRLMIYLGGDFKPENADRPQRYNWFLNLMEVEKQIYVLTENLNTWLLAVKDYDTLQVLDALEKALLYMENLCHISGITVGHALALSLELFGKKWELPTSNSDIWLRRLNEIRKKFLSMGSADAHQNDKNLWKILPWLKPKEKKKYTLSTLLGRNTHGIQKARHGKGRT